MIKTIDYNKLISGDTAEINIFTSAMVKNGAVFVENNRLPDTLSVFKANMMRLFGLPDDVKLRFFSEQYQGSRGYVPSSKEAIKDAKESEKRESFRWGTLWPKKSYLFENVDLTLSKQLEGTEVMRLHRSVTETYESMLGIGFDLLRIIELSCTSATLLSNVKYGNHVLTGQKYDGKEKIDSQPHFDKGYLALLYAPPEGLEYLDGNVWKKVPVSESKVLVSVGRCLSEETKLPAFYHRVRATSARRYISILFINPAYLSI